ncbi:helix-turn-helix transcriptional regulator [Ferruginibacter paludis]|uniref:helix-turn-helix domain-containing protein n=1 Tax=Ferruginibacter paludis TaxID=1310417 RepID=UPI0025B2D9E4|nr:helix-turn-helix transcriptional regulator [Ferruginibacter paludis]MDN3654046.1 helix-turn-helix transcriptional regulator [Ferruginibacter paludis]
MIKKKKLLAEEQVPEFESSIAGMTEESKIFVDKSLEIANYLVYLLQEKGLKQKELADRLGKSEAEVSKWLAGMHNFTLRSLSKLEAALGATIICTPKHLQKSVQVTTIIKMGSVSSKVYKPYNTSPAYCKLVYMKVKENNNESLKEVV